MLRKAAWITAAIAIATISLTANAADPPGWKIHDVDIKGMITNRSLSICITADGKYVVAVDDFCNLGVIDLEKPTAKPLVKKMVFANSVAASSDPKFIWAGGWDGKLSRVEIPSMKETDLGPTGATRISQICELADGFLFAISFEHRHARVLRVRDERVDDVMLLPDVGMDFVASKPIGAELLYLLRKIGRFGDQKSAPAALRISKGSIRLELDVQTPSDELDKLACLDGTKWIISVDKPKRESRIRIDPSGKGDIALPFSHYKAIASPSRPDRIFAATNEGGIVAYEIETKRTQLLIADGAAVDCMAISPDGTTCAVTYSDHGNTVSIMQREKKK